MGNKTEILKSIGNTPLIELSRVVPDGCARILVKLESQNPTGSMKDRMALGAHVLELPSEEALFADTSTGANIVWRQFGLQGAWEPGIPL